VDRKTFSALFAPSGQEVLQTAMALGPREVDFLQHFQMLSRQYPHQLARAALEIAILRGEAGRKFPFADQLYLTREAMEQASSYPISTYRAGRYRGFTRLVDLGCSIGGDTLALAQIAPAIGIDHDPLRLAMARANLQTLGLEASFLQADLTVSLPLSPTGYLPGKIGLFFDPARRVDRRRVSSVRDYQPPLTLADRWVVGFPALGVKISPGIDLGEISAYDAEVEFISLCGELKEAVLWFGPLKTAQRRATLLPGPHTLTPEDPEPVLPLSPPQAYLYEPDPAILRSKLVTTLGQMLNAAQLDPDIAYLTADECIVTPFARVWAVEDWFPFQLKRLRAYLRERQVGRVVVKKRGSPLQPEALIRDLRLGGEHERVVFLTHLRGRPIVVIGFPRGER
jgi:SAM-dependent methyltransferase